MQVSFNLNDADVAQAIKAAILKAIPQVVAEEAERQVAIIIGRKLERLNLDKTFDKAVTAVVQEAVSSYFVSHGWTQAKFDTLVKTEVLATLRRTFSNGSSGSSG